MNTIENILSECKIISRYKKRACKTRCVNVNKMRDILVCKDSSI